MNSNKEPKITEEPIDALAMIKNVVRKLGPTISEAAGSMEKFGRVMTPAERRKNDGTNGSKNKSQKRNKVRYLLAKKSNRINRQRVKGWKY